MDDDVIIHVLLTDAFKRNNYGDYPNVKYSFENPRYGLKAYNKWINHAIFTFRSPLTWHILHDAKKIISVMETVHTRGKVICTDIEN